MKNRMNVLAACALVALAGCCSFFSCDYPSAIDEGFVPLENGNGMIYGEGNPITEKEYGNFILRLEFLMPENGNNGLGMLSA